MKQRIFTGLLAGLICNSLGFLLVIFVIAKLKGKSLASTIDFFWQGDDFWMLLALGALPNLLLFFGLLKRDKEYEARGVVMATFVTAITVFILYFKTF